MTRRGRTVVTAAAVLVTAAPATASAKDVTYHAEAFAKGTYEIHKKRETEDTLDAMDFKASFSYVGNYSTITFRDGRLLSSDDELSPDFAVTVTANHHVQRANGITTTYDCLGDQTQPVPSGSGRLVEAEGGKLGFRPGDILGVGVHGCDTARMSFAPGANLIVPGWSTGSPDDLPAIGGGPIDLMWNNPPEAIGADYVEDIIAMDPNQTSGVSCPGWDEETVSCTLTWSGGVKMWKDGETGGQPSTATQSPPMAQGDDLVLQLPPPVAQGDELILHLRPPMEQGDELILQLSPKGASLSGDGSTASFTATCPTGCSGSGTIAPAGPATGHASSAAAGARQRFHFRLPAGDQKRRVSVRLNGRTRRLVRRAKGARLTVTATANDGTPVRASARLRLPRHH